MKTSSLALSIALFALIASSVANPPNPDCQRTEHNICHNTFENCIRTCDSSFENSRSSCDSSFNTCKTNCTSIQNSCKNSCVCGSNCNSTCINQCKNNSNNNCVNRCKENSVNDCKASCDNPHVTCQNSCQNISRNCSKNLDTIHVTCKNNCTNNQTTCFNTANTKCSNPVPPPNNNNSTVPSPPPSNNTVPSPPPSNNNNTITIYRQSNTELILSWNNKELRIQQLSNQGLLEVYLRETVGNTKNNYKLRIVSFNTPNNGQPGNPINVGGWTPFTVNSNSFSASNTNLTLTGSVSNTVSTKLAGNFAAIGNNSVIFIVQLTAFQQVGNGPNVNIPNITADQILGAFGNGVLTNVKIRNVVTPITRTATGSNSSNGQTQFTFFYTISSGVFTDLVITA